MTIIGAIVGIPFIIFGAMLSVSSRLRILSSVWGPLNIVVTVTPVEGGADVNITYSPKGHKLVNRFLGSLPK